MQQAPKSQHIPVEPVLELDEIQGACIPGFLKPYQSLIGVNSEDSLAGANELRHFIGLLSKEVATGRVTLKDRREHRTFKAKGEEGSKPPVALIGIGVSFVGLSKITPSAASIPSEAFRLGLATRSSLLGDPTAGKSEGAPGNWIVGGGRGELEALILVAGDTPDCIADGVCRVRKAIKSSRVIETYFEAGAVRSDMPGHEHFGFDDGVSQPGIRGRASKQATDFITERHVDKAAYPEHWLFGYPGQTLVWPGEFVLGYPVSSPDPLYPGPIAQPFPDWLRNGSYLVFRRLRQDVGLFWRTMREEAKRLSADQGFRNLSDVELASRLVGRWPSGAPFNRTPDKDLPKLGKALLANNYFRYDSDTEPIPLVHGHDRFPMAKADPAGVTCPWAAHIRKVNTRDSGSDMGTQDSTYKRRLLRVGIPFGKPLTDVYTKPEDDPEKGNRGLLFLSIQASIEDQFEFLSSRWVNDPSRPKNPGGHDFIIGQNGAPDGGRLRTCTMFGSNLKTHELKTKDQWVIPTGGGYFFMPSVSALRDVLGGKKA